MLPFAYYLLKVIICSGILYGYYLLALRNKIFHGWNRFYLLSAIVLSLTVPLIKIDIFQNTGGPTQVIQLLQVVSTGDEFVYEYTKSRGFHIDATNLSVFIYTVVSIFLLVILIQTLIKIAKLKKDNSKTIVEGVNFINTKADGTPFSFFNNIFWNDKIDLNSATGKQIFKHEVAHVQEKHSYDKIFINIVLIFFWCNPFFWLIRKELNIIHEFIADKKALEDSDTAAFAAMILQATYPQQQFNITNNFFYSSLKRRLAMLTKNKNPKISYVSRLLALPLAALVFIAFTLKTKTINPANHYDGKKITVVIDAGHGGDDNGVVVNNIKEEDLTLSIAKEIKRLNTNKNIEIILTREDDKAISVKDRVKIAEVNNADLFISIHIDAALNNNAVSGFNILIPNNDNPYLKESKILGSSMIESFKNNYQLKVANDVKQREKVAWILKANQYPSIIVEAGVLTSQKDLEYLTKAQNQQTVARNILNGIERYAQQTRFAYNTRNSNDVLKEVDTIPQYYKGKKIEKAFGSKKLNSAVIIYADGTSDTVSINEAEKFRIIPPPPSSLKIITDSSYKKGKNPLIVLSATFVEFDVDKSFITAKEFVTGKVSPGSKNVNFKTALIIVNDKVINRELLKGKLIMANKLTGYYNSEELINLYGDAAKNSVMVFTDAEITENNQKVNTDTIPKNFDKVFTKVEVEPSFPGGDMAWAKYVKKIIENNIDELTKENKSGTCRVRFIVSIDGTVSNVEVLTMKGTKVAELSVAAISKGPKWNPAMQNGNKVNAYREQPITFTIAPD